MPGKSRDLVGTSGDFGAHLGLLEEMFVQELVRLDLNDNKNQDWGILFCQGWLWVFLRLNSWGSPLCWCFCSPSVFLCSSHLPASSCSLGCLGWGGPEGPHLIQPSRFCHLMSFIVLHVEVSWAISPHLTRLIFMYFSSFFAFSSCVVSFVIGLLFCAASGWANAKGLF